jgi:hypothetical protein
VYRIVKEILCAHASQGSISPDVCAGRHISRNLQVHGLQVADEKRPVS